MACGPAALALRLLTRRAASLALAGCLFITAGAAAGTDWPQWRGARRDGISQERGMQTSWAGGSPPVAWSRALGEGFSGISIVGDRAYTLVGRGDDELVICIDANTGDDAWDLRIDRKFTEGRGHGPRSTPTVHDGTLYALSAWGTLAAATVETSDLLWSRDLRAEYGGREDASEPWRGYSMSPLVVGSLLVVEVGGTDSRTVMAFDLLSGAPQWSALSDPPAYSSPIAIRADGSEQIVFLNGTAAVALTPSGHEAWRYPWPPATTRTWLRLSTSRRGACSSPRGTTTRARQCSPWAATECARCGAAR